MAAEPHEPSVIPAEAPQRDQLVIVSSDQTHDAIVAMNRGDAESAEANQSVAAQHDLPIGDGYPRSPQAQQHGQRGECE